MGMTQPLAGAAADPGFLPTGIPEMASSGPVMPIGPGMPTGAAMPYTGESCRVGAQVPCACPSGSTGVKTCVEDQASPTGGSYAACQLCDGP